MKFLLLLLLTISAQAQFPNAWKKNSDGSISPRGGEKVVTGVTLPTTAVSNSLGVGGCVYAPKMGIDVRCYGAKGDGSTDDSAAFQRASDAVVAAGGGKIIVPDGATYMVEGVLIYSNTTIHCVSRSAILKAPTGTTYQIAINALNSPATPLVHDVAIENCTFRELADTLGFSEGIYNIRMASVSQIRLTNLYIVGQRGDGVYIQGDSGSNFERHNDHIIIEKCDFDGLVSLSRNAISIIDCDDCTIRDNSFRNVTQAGMPGAIDCEPNFTFAVLRKITIENNSFYGTINGHAIQFFYVSSLNTYPPGLWTIRNNFFSDNTTSTYHYSINIQMAQPVTSSSPATGIIIDGNRFRDSSGDSIQLLGVQGANISRNLFNTPSAKVKIGNYAASGRFASSVIVSNNIFSITGGMLVGETWPLAIVNNQFLNNSNTGDSLTFQTNNSAVFYNLTFTGNTFVQGTSTRTKAITITTASIDPATFKASGNTVDSAFTSSDLYDPAFATCDDSGAADTLVCTAQGVSQLSTGLMLLMTPNHDNTGAATLNINGFGAKAITKTGTTALSAADIKAGYAYVLRWDGTRFRVASGL